VRHRQALEEAVLSLGRSAELRAEDLRLALRSLGRITGAVDVALILNIELVSIVRLTCPAQLDKRPAVTRDQQPAAANTRP